VTKTEDYEKKCSMKNLADDLRNAENKMTVGNFLEDESFAQLTSNFNFLILIFTAINCSYSKLTY